jgi:hypothetical protein
MWAFIQAGQIGQTSNRSESYQGISSGLKTLALLDLDAYEKNNVFTTILVFVRATQSLNNKNVTF